MSARQDGPPRGSDPWPFILAVALGGLPLVLGLLGGLVLVRFTRCRRWWLAVGALTLSAGWAWLLGPENAVAGHFWWATHWARVALAGGAVQHGAWLAAVARQLPLGGMAGLLTASLLPVPVRPEFDPVEVRRRVRRAARQQRHAAARARQAGQEGERVPVNALGVAFGDGALPPRWRAGRYVVLPADVAARPRVVVGASGSGKSVLLVREAAAAAATGRRVVAVDCKGDLAFRRELLAACLRVQPQARVLCWPDEPLDGWRGDPGALLGRLLQVWHFSPEAQFYREVAATIIRLAVTAPGVAPVRSSGELMHRLSAGNLLRLWERDPDAAALLRALRPRAAEVELRVLNLLASLSGALDGRRSWSDADVVVCSLPVMASPADADAAVRVLLADLAHHVASRKRPGEPETVLLDEYAAVSGGRQAALHLAERGRSHGTAVVMAVQSQAGLGEADEAERVFGTAAAVTLLQSPNGDEVAKLAGSVLAPELTWEVRDGQATGRAHAAARHRHKLDMNHVRALRPGQAAVITEGTAGLMHVVRDRPPGWAFEAANEALRAARAVELAPSAPAALPPAPQPEPEGFLP